MSDWKVLSGEILDVTADVLVCSANPYLTLSGGVGGAFLLRYGDAMQKCLRRHLEELSVRHVPPGTVVVMPPCGSPYDAVIHAVAVDAAYRSSTSLITRVVAEALDSAETLGAGSVAMPALATGYGELTKTSFAEGLRPLVDRSWELKEVVVCLRREEDARLVRRCLDLPVGQ